MFWLCWRRPPAPSPYATPNEGRFWGDDVLSASMFALVALDRVRADRDTLTILPDLVTCSELPTPFGRISVEKGKVTGQWHGRAPTIVFTEA